MMLRKLLRTLVLPALLVLCQTGFAQQVVTGRVTGTGGTPVARATVTAKGTASATTTNEQGEFTLTVPAGATTLVVSSVGFSEQEIAVGSGPITVSLQATAANLNEVVVVGYGTQRRRDLTGAVTAVTAKDFQKGNITTPEQLIAGKVAGVQITSNGGAPGAGSRIRIRGGASLNASNDPLIVVDGVPLDNSGISGAANPLSLINPNDIESFNILKDASATAIYGSRASNGVILITTKKGSRGKPVISFNTQQGISEVTRTVDVLSPDAFRAIVNERGNAAQKALLGSSNTDWQDEIYGTAITSDYNLAVSGSLLDRLPVRLSLNHLNQEGVLQGGQVKRYAAGLNLSPRLLNNNLRVDLNLKASRTDNVFANEGAIGAAVAFDPTQPITNKDGRFGGYFEYIDPATNRPNTLSPRNPLALLNLRQDESEVLRSIGNLQLDYSLPFLTGLRANVNLGYDVSRGEGTVFVMDSAAAQYSRGGTNNEYRQNKQNKLLETYLAYNRDLTALKSRVELLGGYSYQDFQTKNFAFPDRRANSEIVPGSEPRFPFDRPQYTLISFYGRLNYNLNDKYILNATLRRDGSSRFAEANRWGLFPAAAFAWRVSSEPFMAGSKTFSDLKLRVGYGVTGQQDVGDLYPYLARFSPGNAAARYQFGNTYYDVYRPEAYDENIKWEETATYNAAVDFGFADNRISGSVDFYLKKTKDLLAEVNIPVGSNFSNRLLTNVGNLENRGVELTVNTVPVRNNRLTWDLNFNVTYNKNEITNLTLAQDPDFEGNLTGGISGGTGNSIQINSVGYGRNVFYVYQQVYGQDGRPIEGAYVDQNRDGIINEKDLYRYKSSEPDVFFGFSSQATLGKFNGGFVLRGSLGNYSYNNVNANLGVYRTITGNSNYLVNGTPDVLASGFNNNQYFSDYYVQNASFARMDNIYVGYDFGQVLNKRAGLRVNLNVQNAFVITKYDGLDPEIAGGIDNNFYPRPRTISLGANLQF